MTLEDGLRARIRELEDELEEWRSGAKAFAAEVASNTEIAAAITAFKITSAQAKTLLALAKSPGRVLSRGQIRTIVGAEKHNTADFHLCYLRKALLTAGIHQPFHNVYGIGWTMSKAAADQILRAIGPT